VSLILSAAKEEKTAANGEELPDTDNQGPFRDHTSELPLTLALAEKLLQKASRTTPLPGRSGKGGKGGKRTSRPNANAVAEGRKLYLAGFDGKVSTSAVVWIV
jgi:hypothetical protein